MGFSVSLYAIFDRQPSQVQRELGLEFSGETAEFPDSSVAGAMTKAGVYILYVNDRDLWGETLMRPVIRNSRVISCNINETCMYSAVTASGSGREEWSIIHDSNEGLMHLETHGDLPDAYPAIRDEKRSLQETGDNEADHVFEVPVEVFVACGGIPYDRDMDSDDPRPWQTLVPIVKPKNRKTWWWPFS